MLCCCCLSTLLLDMQLGLFLVVLHDLILLDENVQIMKGNEAPSATCMESGLKINTGKSTRVGTLIMATIYLQLIQNRYMFRSFTVLHCSHQHCVQPVASDVEVIGCL